MVFSIVTASNLLRLSYQGPASCSVLVDENGGVSDPLATPKSSANHTRTSENTGRWSPAAGRARGKRSLDRRRYRPPGTLDGERVGAGVGDADNGDGTAVHDDDNPNGVVPYGTLGGARTNHALPRQMYDALMTVRSRGWWRPSAARRAKHRKRQAADAVVLRREPSDGAEFGEDVDIVPLADAERGRIRLNLTIGSEDDPVGGPVYAVSLSLPGADRLLPQQQQQQQPKVARASAAARPAPSPSAGTECACFCPCLDSDDDDDGDGDRWWDVTATTPDATQSATVVPVTSTPSTDDDDGTTLWTTSSSTTSEPSEVLTCPPPVLIFCDTGKSRARPVFTLRRPRRRRRRTEETPLPRTWRHRIVVVFLFFFL